MPAYVSILAQETVIVAVAAALQASTGMGMALFAAPLLALIDPDLVPGPSLCAVVFLSAIVAWRERRALDPRMLGIALCGLLLGTIAGALVLASLSGWHLARVFAAIILGLVVLSLLGMRVRAGRAALLIGGAASGLLGTMAGVHGPPIAIVLQNEPPERLRGMLCAFFAIGGTISLLALAGVGVFGTAQLRRGVELLPGVAIGLILAPLLARAIDRRHARLAILAISSVSAFVLLL